ncbi:cyclase, partial [Mycobacterium sp. ITM-2017-0098]
KVADKGITSRGVLLDVVAHRGADVFCEPGNPITPADLDEIAAEQNIEIRSGDIVVVHTGWWTRFLETGDGG